jgi:hypothetical protein
MSEGPADPGRNALSEPEGGEIRGRALGCTCSTSILAVALLVINGFLGVQILTATAQASPSGSSALLLWIVLLVGELGLGGWLTLRGGREHDGAERVFGAGMVLGALLTGALFALLAGVCMKINQGH